MRWEQFFWIVYGIGSTLFVFYLFKLGNAVGGNREESVKSQIDRPRTSDQMPAFAASDTGGPLQDWAGQCPAGRAFGAGDANADEAVAPDGVTNGFLLTNGGLHTGSGLHRHAGQGRSVPSVHSR